MRLLASREWQLRHSIDLDQCEMLQIAGDSMHPTLPDGSEILVDRSRRTLVCCRIYAFNTATRVIVKRLDLRGGGWFLVSDNTRYPTLPLHPFFRLIGEVRWFSRVL